MSEKMGWQLIEEESETWINTDNLIKINVRYSLQKSIGKTIGFRYKISARKPRGLAPWMNRTFNLR